MKILVAVDSNPYSENAVNEVSALAANTWANVTFLGVNPESAVSASNPAARPEEAMQGVLNTYMESFLKTFSDGICPYSNRVMDFKWNSGNNGLSEAFEIDPKARKVLIRRIRGGNATRAILTEVQEDPSDLIVIGCDPPPNEAFWADSQAVPEQIVDEAPCSVMVVKNQREINNVIWCFDQSEVTQSSLELINQLMSIHQAGLTLVGFTGGSGELKADIERRMFHIINYYKPLNIKPMVESVDQASFENFISKKRRRELMALAMGTRSIWRKWFTQNKMSKVLKESQSSMLVLR